MLCICLPCEISVDNDASIFTGIESGPPVNNNMYVHVITYDNVCLTCYAIYKFGIPNYSTTCNT